MDAKTAEIARQYLATCETPLRPAGTQVAMSAIASILYGMPASEILHVWFSLGMTLKVVMPDTRGVCPGCLWHAIIDAMPDEVEVTVVRPGQDVGGLS